MEKTPPSQAGSLFCITVTMQSNNLDVLCLSTRQFDCSCSVF